MGWLRNRNPDPVAAKPSKRLFQDLIEASPTITIAITVGGRRSECRLEAHFFHASIDELALALRHLETVADQIKVAAARKSMARKGEDAEGQ